jgi:hypothetical protein
MRLTDLDDLIQRHPVTSLDLYGVAVEVASGPWPAREALVQW